MKESATVPDSNLILVCHWPEAIPPFAGKQITMSGLPGFSEGLDPALVVAELIKRKLYVASGEHRRQAILDMHLTHPNNIYLKTVTATVIIANFNSKEDCEKLIELGNRANKISATTKATDDTAKVIQMHRFYNKQGFLKKAKAKNCDVTIPNAHLQYFAKLQCSKIPDADAAKDSHLNLLARVASRYGREWQLILECIGALMGSKTDTSGVKFSFYQCLSGINQAVRCTLLRDALQDGVLHVAELKANATRFRIQERVRREAIEFYNLKRTAVSKTSLPVCLDWTSLCGVLPFEENNFLSVWYEHASHLGYRQELPKSFTDNIFAMMVTKCKGQEGIQRIAEVKIG